MDSLFLEKHRNEIRGKIILITKDKSVHEGDSIAFSSRLTDSQLAKMPDTYMYTREQLDAMIPFFKTIYNRKLKLKSLGALALINAPGRWKRWHCYRLEFGRIQDKQSGFVTRSRYFF